MKAMVKKAWSRPCGQRHSGCEIKLQATFCPLFYHSCKSPQCFTLYSPNFTKLPAAGVYQTPKNYEWNTLRPRSWRNFPAVIRDREEKKVIVILSSFLRHFYFQPFSLQSKKNSATERKEKNRRLACHMLSLSLSLSLPDTLDCFGLWKLDRK